MSVIVAPRSGGGLLGTLGTIAGIGGSLFGAPWLGALGMGMNAANAAMNGNPAGVASAMSGIMNGEYGGMQNPMAGNIAQSEEEQALRAWQEAMMRQQMSQNNWGW